MNLSELEPRTLWSHFDAIRRVPRPSRHEERIRAHLLAWARERGYEARTDAAGNVVVRVAATPGHENAPVVVLQAHMDMVCEKNDDVRFDFMNDAIEVERDGDWLTARGTTLGADNGVGLAAAMAVADDPDVVHGPLEVFATVDEETGLTGATAVDPSLLEGRILLNLDTEEIDALYVGCAGGADTTITLPVTEADVPADAEAWTVWVRGLRGGHSGMDIVEQRGNAIRVLARVLDTVRRAHGLTLARIEGGGVHNAIPREAGATVFVAREVADAARESARRAANAIREELSAVDPEMTLEIGPAEPAPARAWDDATTARVVAVLLAMPHGVEAMSRDVAGLVETSNNLASVWTREEGVVVGTSSRSSVGSALDGIRARVRAVGELGGGRVEEHDGYPGWKPDMNSPLLATARRVHREVLGVEPEIKAVHAGLECGIIGEKFPGMDMISMGPTIEAPHSPDERVNIPSVQRFWTFLRALVAELARSPSA